MKGQVILRNLQWSGKHNPGFPPGSVQTAVAELLNPTSSILPYSGHLCLGEPRVVCTGTKYFNIDAGATKNVNFQILMPTVEGTYPVHLDIFSNDQLLIDYRADESVVIGVVTGFTLKLKNAPQAAVLWNANFAENSFKYTPMADSGWLAIDKAWNYPSDPEGCTTLRIWALDANNNILFDVRNLGPVENGKSYIFDCITKRLEIG